MDKPAINLQQCIQTGDIEQLREIGYRKNFRLTGDRSILCLEDNNCFSYDLVTIRLVDHVFDLKLQRLLFVVETTDGNKGLMTLPMSGVKQKSPPKPKTELIEAFWLAL